VALSPIRRKAAARFAREAKNQLIRVGTRSSGAIWESRPMIWSFDLSRRSAKNRFPLFRPAL
jgi:hypothetical protein